MYVKEKADYAKTDEALKRLVKFVFETVNSRYLTIALGTDKTLGRNSSDIHELLCKLKAGYSPTDDTRRIEIQMKYDSLRHPTTKRSKESWIEDWIQTVEEMVELDLKT